MLTINPCPFCGSDKAPRIYDVANNGIQRIMCISSTDDGKGIGCGAAGPYGRVGETEKVIQEWNNRR